MDEVQRKKKNAFPLKEGEKQKGLVVQHAIRIPYFVSHHLQGNKDIPKCLSAGSLLNSPELVIRIRLPISPYIRHQII